MPNSRENFFRDAKFLDCVLTYLVRSMYSGTRNNTSVTTGALFYELPLFLPLQLLNYSRIVREAGKTYNANDTMLRRSDQLLLATENHHF